MSTPLVRPKYFQGMNLSLTLNLGGIGPKFTITCGACSVTFRKRIPLVDDPVVVCPHCGARNQLPLAY